MRNIVNALLIREGEILLARRSPQRKAYPDCWSFPGGHVESGETIEEALFREVSEEIGIVPLNYYLTSELADPNVLVDPITYHLFVMTAWCGNPTIQDEEHSELRWFPLSTAVSLSDLALEAYRSIFDGLRGSPLMAASGGISRW